MGRRVWLRGFHTPCLPCYYRDDGLPLPQGRDVAAVVVHANDTMPLSRPVDMCVLLPLFFRCLWCPLSSLLLTPLPLIHDPTPPN